MSRSLVVSRAARRRRSAYSLLELIIVLAIVATLFGMTMPRFANAVGRHRTEAAGRRLVADLTLARRRAETTSTAVTVQFDVSGDTYTLVGVLDLDHGTGPYTVNLASAGLSLDSAVFDDATDGADALDEVVFDGYGIPDSDGTVVLGGGAVSVTVVLDESSGEATIQ